MDCETFTLRLAEFLGNALTGVDRRAAEEHLAGCPRCRKLARVGAEPTHLEPEPPDDLVGSILERTTGSPCASAHERLAPYVDATLGTVDDELVKMHLERCGDCRSIAEAISSLSADLPALAELEPDAGFVDDVLARTLPASVRRRRRIAAWSASWQRLFQRPRFALEGAYVGTLVLILLFGLPNSPLAAVPKRALELVQVNPVEEIGPPLASLEDRVTTSLGSFWESTSRRVSESSRTTATKVTRVSNELIESVRSDFGTLLDRFASEQMSDEPDRSSDDGDRIDGDKQ